MTDFGLVDYEIDPDGFAVITLNRPEKRKALSRALLSELETALWQADDDSWQPERGQQKLRVLWDMHKPTIAQIHGYCLAGGTDLALFCDMVIDPDLLSSNKRVINMGMELMGARVLQRFAADPRRERQCRREQQGDLKRWADSVAGDVDVVGLEDEVGSPLTVTGDRVQHLEDLGSNRFGPGVGGDRGERCRDRRHQRWMFGLDRVDCVDEAGFGLP
ncbi:MAG: hypothetical protein GY745_11010 [Actinomycetia bacterium]|nr:hypothetical protein [Actinomycetes bacterium]MCP4085567.1 hypothetical protein [Actinomycetes bacterium]